MQLYLAANLSRVSIKINHTFGISNMVHTQGRFILGKNRKNVLNVDIILGRNEGSAQAKK